MAERPQACQLRFARLWQLLSRELSLSLLKFGARDTRGERRGTTAFYTLSSAPCAFLATAGADLRGTNADAVRRPHVGRSVAGVSCQVRASVELHPARLMNNWGLQPGKARATLAEHFIFVPRRSEDRCAPAPSLDNRHLERCMSANVLYFPKYVLDDAMARGRLPLCNVLQEAARAVHLAVVEVGPSNLSDGDKAALYERLLHAARDLETCANILTRDLVPNITDPVNGPIRE